MAGMGYTHKLWVFTVGGVRMNKAYVHTPTEWGQTNTATYVNLGVYRKLPEVSKYIEVYGGLGRMMFGRQGPAPLSMASTELFPLPTRPMMAHSSPSFTSKVSSASKTGPV